MCWLELIEKNAEHVLSQWHYDQAPVHVLNNCQLSERMEADGFSGSTCDREFYPLSRICCCLLFAYSQHSFLFKSDYLARSLWGILEPLSLLMSALDNLAGNMCGRQVRWLILLWSRVQAEKGLNVNECSWSMSGTGFPYDSNSYSRGLSAAFLFFWATSNCSASF